MLASPLFAKAAHRVLEQKRGGWHGRCHAQNWIRSLERYAFPRIGGRSVSEMNTAEVLEILTPISRLLLSKVGAVELEQPPVEIVCCAHRAGAGRGLRRTPPRTRLRVRLLPEASARASLMPSGLEASPVPPIAGAQGWRGPSRSAGHSDACSASRSGIPFPRPARASLRGGSRVPGLDGRCAKGTFAARSGCVRSRRRSVRGGPLRRSSDVDFVLLAEVCRGWFRVATPCSRSCSISVVWLFRHPRSCGADSFNFRRLRSGRMSRWMSAPEAALRVGVARRFRGGGSCR